jgi:hypothetical protein
MRVAFRLGFRVRMRVLHRGIRRTHLLLLAPALTFVLAAGCGSNNGGSSNSSSDSPAFSDALVASAATKAKQAAAKVVEATRDKNLPGPKRYLVVCSQRGDPDAGTIPPNTIKCHIEAFYKDYRGKPGGYIWSEDWQVPVQNGKLGTPAIMGLYRIQNFLREDNKRNCTGRHQPRECLPQSTGGVLPG